MRQLQLVLNYHIILLLLAFAVKDHYSFPLGSTIRQQPRSTSTPLPATSNNQHASSADTTTTTTTTTSSSSSSYPESNTGDFSDVIIVGGGLVGMAIGVAFKNRNISSVTIYEQATELRKIGAAIGLYPNGISALGYIDSNIQKAIQQTASSCQTFERRNLQNDIVQTTEVPTIKATAPIMYTWYLLQQALAEAVPKKCIQLGHVLKYYKILENGLVQATFEKRKQHNNETTTTTTITCRLLIGADGIHSDFLSPVP